MYYEINVSLNGSHLFATHERSLHYKEQAEKLYRLFDKKFPAKEGYQLTITSWELIGHSVTFDNQKG